MGGVSGGLPPFSGAMMTKASDWTSQNFTGAGLTFIWDTADYDYGGWTDLSNERFVIPAGVTLVDIFAHVRLVNFTASSNFVIYIVKGGASTFPGHTSQQVTNSASVDVTCTALGVPVTAGDLITLVGFSSGDASCDVTANRTSFSIRKVA